ncbi:hypothetical protein RRG08_044453 [Elysia crispata]|uniref:Uncharacterized protein n=1 Tax=Elysia crispata TaxID=231223 RepID=A0AAE1E2N4_9GAST|nr:hypothetical protein RRG08_044453 [Elysia crispata]
MEPELPRVQPRPERTAHTIRRPRGETIHLARKNIFGLLRAPSYRSEDGLAGLGVRRGTRLSNAKTFVYG